MKKHVFAVDPGDKNNGFTWIIYDTETKKGDTKAMEVLSSKLFSQRLHQLYLLGQRDTVDASSMYFVVENFRVDSKIRGAMFQFNEVLTARNIGKVEFVADAIGANCVLQEPAQVLSTARRWAPFKLNKGHIRDDHSSWLHACYFMMNKKWIGTPDQITLFGQEKLE